MVDASAVAEYLLRTPAGDAVEAAIRDDLVRLHTPALCDVEVASILRRALLEDRLSVERVAEALDDYLILPLTRHGHLPLLGRILVLRHNFSAYDSCYLALAERLEGSLLTGDRKLAAAARRHLALDVRPTEA